MRSGADRSFPKEWPKNSNGPNLPDVLPGNWNDGGIRVEDEIESRKQQCDRSPAKAS